MESIEVKYPNIPVYVALQEAEDLYFFCQADKEKLISAGLDWNLAEDLPNRINNCRHAQSQWAGSDQVAPEQKEWTFISPIAHELRCELLHHFAHAYRKLPDVYDKVQRNRKKLGHADTIQALSNLCELGKANAQPLQSINFDFGLLDKAGSMSEELALLLAKANAKKLQGYEKRLERDKAFSCMKQSVDEIRRIGQYVFWRDKSKYTGYTSAFLRKKNRKRSKNPPDFHNDHSNS